MSRRLLALVSAAGLAAGGSLHLAGRGDVGDAIWAIATGLAFVPLVCLSVPRDAIVVALH